MSLGTKVDGVTGPQTLRGLDAINRNQDTGNLFALQERARVAASGTSLVGRTFVIEAATTVVDFQNLPMTDEQSALERQITLDIASRLVGRLEAIGAGALLLEGDAVEVNRADTLGASAVITVTADVSKSKDANGVATFFFGHERQSDLNSPTGQKLAELIQGEVVARTGMLDCRTHARTWSSLKRPRPGKSMSSAVTSPIKKILRASRIRTSETLLQTELLLLCSGSTSSTTETQSSAPMLRQWSTALWRFPGMISGESYQAVPGPVPRMNGMLTTLSSTNSKSHDPLKAGDNSSRYEGPQCGKAGTAGQTAGRTEIKHLARSAARAAHKPH